MEPIRRLPNIDWFIGDVHSPSGNTFTGCIGKTHLTENGFSYKAWIDKEQEELLVQTYDTFHMLSGELPEPTVFEETVGGVTEAEAFIEQQYAAFLASDDAKRPVDFTKLGG